MIDFRQLYRLHLECSSDCYNQDTELVVIGIPVVILGAQCNPFCKKYHVFQDNDKALSEIQGPSESGALCDQIDLTPRKLT